MIKQAKRKFRISEPAADYQLWLFAEAAAHIFRKKPLTGAENRAYERQNELPAVCMARELQIKIVLAVIKLANGFKIFRIMGQHNFKSFAAA